MTAKEAAEQPEQTPLSDLREAALRHYEEVSSLAHHWNGAIPTAINFYYDALEVGATWKEEQLQQWIDEALNAQLESVVETLYSHYKNNGGYTRTAAGFIEKITGKKWERDKEIEELQQRIKELEDTIERIDGLSKTQYSHWKRDLSRLGDAQAEIQNLKEQQGKFAEWAFKNEWKFSSSYYPDKWFKIVSVDKDEMTYTGQRNVIHKTTAELLAEFDKRGDNDGSNRQGK